ncbi:MAG: winged helix-turn-helix transcriptional regulator [Pararhodobacter sp.]|nr:winged helix-turn-helix transcriptional regulator [Pararhodobacter sp.]
MTGPIDTATTTGPAAAPADSITEGAPFLGDYLLFLLAAASASASAGFHAIVRQNGLRVPEWRVLACLHDRDGQMVTRLAALALMEQSAMTRVIERMEERSLVTRRSDPRDRRRVRVFLAPDGRALLEALLNLARDQEAQVLACLPPEQRRALKPMLASLLAALPGNPLSRHDEDGH